MDKRYLGFLLVILSSLPLVLVFLGSFTNFKANGLSVLGAAVAIFICIILVLLYGLFLIFSSSKHERVDGE
jgi:hypothetical protein